MKSILYLFVGGLLLIACESSLVSQTKKNEITKEITFVMDSISSEDFDLVEKDDTTFYIKKLYEGIDGKKIRFDENEFSNLEAKIKFEFSFLQYTIDDNPAYPISFSKESSWVNLKLEKGQLQIPDFGKNSNSIQVYEVLGLSSKKDLIKWVEGDSFESIRKESYDSQLVFFQELINKKKEYETCCPEYIEQALRFLKTPINEFTTIDNLGLELICKTIVLEIKGQLKNGQEVRKVIVGK